MRKLISTSRIRLIAVTTLVGFSLFATQAATIISGNVSGAWPISGSPYLLTDTTTVPAGQTLSIDPGVTVIVGSNLQFVVQGTVLAVGTKALPIVFRGTNPSNYWQYIFVNWNGNPKSRFVFCQISDAQAGIYMVIQTIYGTQLMELDILDTRFSNIQGSCISGQSIGSYNWVGGPSGGNSFGYPKLKPSIQGCQFTNVTRGCYFVSSGDHYSYPGGFVDSRGSVELRIANCAFGNVTETAIGLEQSTYSDYSYLFVHNNLILGSGNGVLIPQSGGSVRGAYPDIINNVFVANAHAVVVSDFADAVIRNNIFSGNTNGVLRAGSLSSKVEFNCFYGNQANFVGYPTPYGQIVWQNNNGTPSDLLYNILQNPLFVSTNDFHLQTNSLCIDAGSPDWNYTDMWFSNSVSQGTSLPDLGVYGGPSAVNWLDVVPVIPVTAFMSRSNNLTWLNWGALPRSEYQIQYLTNLVLVGTNNWQNLTNGRVLAADKLTSFAVSPTPLSNSKAFFRVRSFGRTPGN